MQTILNAGFGLFIGVGLWLIGVPNAVLWGILAGLMRFVPFVGSIIAAFFPIALAAAVDPGWSMVLATAALFIVAEPVAGHVIEPVLYGQHTADCRRLPSSSRPCFGPCCGDLSAFCSRPH